jgi:hypothetical protein
MNDPCTFQKCEAAREQPKWTRLDRATATDFARNLPCKPVLAWQAHARGFAPNAREVSMKQLLVASWMAVALCGPAHAEDATTPAVSSDTANPKAPVAGANSFTEDQARTRITEAGYTDVSGLMKGDDGIWRGKASKGGSIQDVQLDFQGNVTSK